MSEHPDSELAVSIEEITPEYAQTILQANTKNRSLRIHRVRQYSQQMSKGQWLLVGDPIRLDKNGNLLDGQHRLHAVVMHGQPVKFLVVRNLPSESFVVIDSGLNRTPGDGLGAGVGASSHKAAAVRIMYIIEAGGDPRKSEDRQAVTRQDIHDYYVAHTEEVEDATLIGQSLYTHLRGNRSAWIAFAIITGRIDMNLRNAFLNGLKTGAGLLVGDPRLALRNWLSQKGNKKVDSSGDHLSLYIKSWNDWMKGQKRTIMRLASNEDGFPTAVTKTKEALL